MAYTNYYSNSNILHCSAYNMMGTQLDILMVGEDESKLQAVWSRVESRLHELELMMSRYKEGGELYRLNRDALYNKLKPTQELWGVLKSCFNYYNETSGYFDITLGCRSFVDIDSDMQTIELFDGSVELDLGGYGKGYALNAIKQIADDSDIENMFVSFGNSSIMARGAHPCYDCWIVSTSNPYSGEAVDSFELRDTTLTVSGNSPSHPEHIYDPYRSEYNSKHRMVSVVCDDPTLGEVLSTTGMMMEKSQFEQLVGNYNVKESKIVEL